MNDEMLISRALVRQALNQLTINRTNFRRAPPKSICKMLAGGNDDVINGLHGALARKQPEPVPEPKRMWYLSHVIAALLGAIVTTVGWMTYA